MEEPLVQVVDEQDRPIGGATKQELWAKGLRHRVVRIMISDSKGRILLQKRSMKKPNSPGKWDNSVAGHVDEGEAYDQAARRELQEELGIADSSPTEIGEYTTDTVRSGRILRRFEKVYGLHVDPSTKFRFNPEEVTEVKWVTLNELRRLIDTSPEQATMGLQNVVTRNLLGVEG